jgi:hypothetical protein
VVPSVGGPLWNGAGQGEGGREDGGKHGGGR